jgi:hypothetical protein
MSTQTLPVAELINFPFDSNWVSGTVGEYTFEAKLFDDPSTYGINNGRISKLSIYNDQKRIENRDFFAACIVNYDRGWDIKPTKESRPYYKAVLKLLELTPRRFDAENALN